MSRTISLAYSRIKFSDIAAKLLLDSPADAEFIVAKVFFVYQTIFTVAFLDVCISISQPDVTNDPQDVTSSESYSRLRIYRFISPRSTCFPSINVPIYISIATSLTLSIYLSISNFSSLSLSFPA